jgi:16S rRNA (uracil1498-N3)-methyltransferase
MFTLFFVDDLPTSVGSSYEFANDDANHAIRVLRMQTGAEFMLSDGKGSWSQVQAIPKGDRAKEAIELLTEAGVDRIVPWASARSIGKGSDKFAVTAREASKQSRRFRIPEVTDLVTTAQICEAIKISDLAIAFHESATSKLSDQVSSHNVEHLLIIIGPEGGLTDEEISAFTEAGAKVALMGRPILRSAHAGIAAVSAVSALLKVW